MLPEPSDAAPVADARPPFFYQTHLSMDVIRENFSGARRATAIAVYVTFTELANRKGGAAARDGGFRVTRKTIAAHAGVATGTLDRYVNELEALGLIEVIREKIGSTNLPNRWVIREPSVAPLPPSVEGGASTGEALRARSSSEPKNPSDEENPLGGALAVIDPERPRNRPATVNGKPVKDAEYELAVQVLALFNEAAGTHYSSGLIVSKIIRRIREHPDLDVAAHARVVAANFADPWWKDDPAPEVLYGNESIFERSMHKADRADFGGGATMKPSDAATYGTEWGPGTPYDTPGAARAAASKLAIGDDAAVDAEHWEVADGE